MGKTTGRVAGHGSWLPPLRLLACQGALVENHIFSIPAAGRWLNPKLMRDSLPPGPAVPAFRQGVRFGAEPYAFLDECCRLYGDCFTLRLPADPPRVVCSHPEDIRRILTMPPDAYVAGDVPFPLNLGPRGLLFLDGERHMADRHLMAPTLHGEHLSTYVQTMQRIAAAAVDSWPVGASFTLRPAMQQITLRIILECVLGLNGGRRVERLAELFTRWLDGALSPAMFMLGVALRPRRIRDIMDRLTAASSARYPEGARFWRVLPWQRLADQKAEILSILRQEIASCRAHITPSRSDVLAMLVQARYEDGSSMDDDTLVDELVTMLVGGHETTANSLCWLFYCLMQHPQARQRIRHELSSVCPDGVLSAARLKQLVYLDACIQESMRLYPAAPTLSRNLTRPLALRSLVLPAGVIAWACIRLAHKRPETWPEPEAFRPERFLEDNKVSPNEFLPFGGGPRRCIGMAFAALEMSTVAAEVLLKAELSLAKEARPLPVLRGISIAPADGLPVVCSRTSRAPE